MTYSTDGTGATGADVVVVVVGEAPYAEFSGDRRDLSLSAGDLAAIRNAKQAGIPVVVVVVSGRPVILGEVWPASMAQIPINAGDASYSPLFPLGFGLRY